MAAYKIMRLGVLSYSRCLEVQYEYHRKVAHEGEPDTFLLVEHPPTVTIGHQAKTNSLLQSESQLKTYGVDLVKTDRGGDATAHEPGQLVIYPIVNLARMRGGFVGPKKFVDILESSVIAWLGEQGVKASVDLENPGVWIGKNKIAAIGIRIRDRTTYHGIAINLVNDLKTFQWIIPCGLSDRGVISFGQIATNPIAIESVGDELVSRITSSLYKL